MRDEESNDRSTAAAATQSFHRLAKHLLPYASFTLGALGGALAVLLLVLTSGVEWSAHKSSKRSSSSVTALTAETSSSYAHSVDSRCSNCTACGATAIGSSFSPPDNILLNHYATCSVYSPLYESIQSSLSFYPAGLTYSSMVASAAKCSLGEKVGWIKCMSLQFYKGHWYIVGYQPGKSISATLLGSSSRSRR